MDDRQSGDSTRLGEARQPKQWRIIRRWAVFLPMMVVLLVGVYLWWKYPHFVVDDAFISARYARNLAEYGQLNWNPGQNPVEGYTGVFLPLLLAGVMKLGAVNFAGLPAIYGLLAFLGTGWLLWRIFVDLKVPWLLQVAWITFYALMPCLHPHIFSGLETFIFIFWVTLDSWLLIRLLRDRGRSMVPLALVGLLTTLTRPEGAAVAAVFVLFALAHTWRVARGRFWRSLVEVGLVAGLPGAAYFLWRWQYYGYLLPNTFYVKQTSGLSWVALVKFARFGALYLLWPVLAAILAGLALVAARKRIPSDLEKFLRQGEAFLGAALLTIGAILAAYLRSDLIMDYAYRFFVPFVPLVLIATAWLSTLGWLALADRPRIRPGWLGLAPALLALGIILVYPGQYFLEKRIAKDYQAMMDAQQILIGRQLKENIPAKEWLATIIDSGAIPYYSDLPTIDFGKLNDEWLAHGRPGLRQQVDYLFDHDPGAIVVTSYRPDVLVRDDLADAITADPRFGRYTLVERTNSGLPPDEYYGDYFLFVYVRSDLAVHWEN